MSTKYPGGIISKTAPTPSGPYADSTAPGVWTLEQQAYWQELGQWPTQGNVNPSAFIENLFSTYLYTGNGSTQTITNGIDLAGEGGLVWTKQRNGTNWHCWNDSARGTTQTLFSNNTNNQSNYTTGLTGFNADGYSIGSLADFNTNAATFASWTFRKQPKFFDVVTYTGTGSTSLTVNHNLGSTPGCIIIKWTSGTGYGWYVYHRATSGTPQASCLVLNSTGAAFDLNGGSSWIVPSSTNFQVATTDGGANASGESYVAYLFAHDAGGFGLSGTENVISCGSYTGNGSTTGPVIDLGYEPQWLLIKKADSATTNTGWAMFDNMRGLRNSGGVFLYANSSAAEDSSVNIVSALATGFQPVQSGFLTNGNGSTYIYVAIRRGPMAVPTLGTSVYNAISRSGTGATANVTGVGFPPDAILATQQTGWTRSMWDRLRGPLIRVATNQTSAETSIPDSVTAYGQDGVTLGADTNNDVNTSGDTYINWFFRRAPSFFDEVCYTGNGTAGRTITHNLTVTPELIITKERSVGSYWYVYSQATGPTQYLRLESTNAPATYSGVWNDTAPTSSVFTVGSDGYINASGQTYVAYLFATCAGVSKVGSYTGTGATQTISCGFTSGARFVLIKRTDDTGAWYVWDTVRGMVSGTDPKIPLNAITAQSNADWVYTSTGGFQIVTTDASVNASGGTYIFLAIA